MEVANCEAGVFAYGDYARGQEEIKWFGVKGVYMRTTWCEKMHVIMDNLHLSQFGHVDVWLANRIRSGEERDFRLLTPLGGHSHRMSSIQNEG